ncbi:MAG: hypothetical protein KGJ78_03730 [Alphaproteobacteria bacterium]|nr:hypothetical protein [Alphaproteobacteria bacterium]
MGLADGGTPSAMDFQAAARSSRGVHATISCSGIEAGRGRGVISAWGAVVVSGAQSIVRFLLT